MSLLDRLFGKPNFFRFDDCYAIDRERLWIALAKAIQTQTAQHKLVILICHFPETFSAVQDQLIHADIEYEIASQQFNVDQLTESKAAIDQSVLLVLSDLIDDDANWQPTQPIQLEFESAIMVCERHPLRQKDRKLEDFAKSLPLPVQLGYFLALQDAVIKLGINQMTYQLLIQMGIEDQELFTSTMVTRRLNKVLDRIEKLVKSEVPADSAEEWLENNLNS